MIAWARAACPAGLLHVRASERAVRGALLGRRSSLRGPRGGGDLSRARCWERAHRPASRKGVHRLAPPRPPAGTLAVQPLIATIACLARSAISPGGTSSTCVACPRRRACARAVRPDRWPPLSSRWLFVQEGVDAAANSAWCWKKKPCAESSQDAGRARWQLSARSSSFDDAAAREQRQQSERSVLRHLLSRQDKPLAIRGRDALCADSEQLVSRRPAAEPSWDLRLDECEAWRTQGFRVRRDRGLPRTNLWPVASRITPPMRGLTALM
jgi:hypothetical protein